MSSKEEYKRKFQDLLEIEEKAAAYYKFYLDKVRDNFLLVRLNEVYSDELRHVEIAQSILSCFE